MIWFAYFTLIATTTLGGFLYLDQHDYPVEAHISYFCFLTASFSILGQVLFS